MSECRCAFDQCIASVWYSPAILSPAIVAVSEQRVIASTEGSFRGDLFMTGFTTLDPFHANAYMDRVLAQSTGDFAKQYRDKKNEILVQVAQAEPTKGTTLDAAVERWNDDGSANVLVATDVTYKTPDQKQLLDNTNRWVATAQREGDQWKISSLQQVI